MELLNKKDEEISQVGHIKQQKFIGRLKPKKGHSVFEYNTQTGEIKEAKIEISVDLYLKETKKLVIDNKCIYKCFLNLKNAKKKFPKLIANDTRQ